MINPRGSGFHLAGHRSGSRGNVIKHSRLTKNSNIVLQLVLLVHIFELNSDSILLLT